MRQLARIVRRLARFTMFAMLAVAAMTGALPFPLRKHKLAARPGHSAEVRPVRRYTAGAATVGSTTRPKLILHAERAEGDDHFRFTQIG